MPDCIKDDSVRDMLYFHDLLVEPYRFLIDLVAAMYITLDVVITVVAVLIEMSQRGS